MLVSSRHPDRPLSITVMSLPPSPSDWRGQGTSGNHEATDTTPIKPVFENTTREMLGVFVTEPACRGAVWCGLWCGLWCGVWCGVVWCVVWCGVVCVWCGVVWCGVAWCGEVWCGVVCGVVWRGGQGEMCVHKRLPKEALVGADVMVLASDETLVSVAVAVMVAAIYVVMCVAGGGGHIACVTVCVCVCVCV
jgi:hypothetical protein